MKKRRATIPIEDLVKVGEAPWCVHCGSLCAPIWDGNRGAMVGMRCIGCSRDVTRQN